jgi:two-component system, cell cycle sensor histidine kinase and response regulator CckA
VLIDGEEQERGCRRMLGRRPGPGFTILLVEDGEPLRRLMVRLLEAEGHAVKSAASGEEAMRILRADPDGVDLLLTDMVLTDIRGGELARRARKLRPDLRVIYTSGYGGEIMAGDAMPAGDRFLGKPFTAEQLADAIAGAYEP